MEKRKFVKSLGIVLLYIIILVLEGLIPSILFRNSKNLYSFGLIMACFVALILVFLITKVNAFEEIEKFNTNRKENIRIAFNYWVKGLLIMYITNIILYNLTGGISNNQSAINETIKELMLYSLISTCFYAPICEELVFRYNFRNSIKNDYVFALITGSIFGFMHVLFSAHTILEYMYFIPYAALGTAFGLIYRKTGTICSSIFMHMFHNAVAFLLIILTL